MSDPNEINTFIESFATFEERKNAVLALRNNDNNNGIFQENYRGFQLSDRVNYLFERFSEIKPVVNTIKNFYLQDINKTLREINGDFFHLTTNINDWAIVSFLTKINTYISHIEAIKLLIAYDDRANEELNKTLKKYENTVSKLELSTGSLDFKDTALVCEKNAQKWLWVIIILSVILTVVLIIFTCTTWFDNKIFTQYQLATKNYKNAADYFNVLLYFEIFKKSMLRILIISLIIYFIKFAISNYNSFLHNKTVNQHKANTLDAATRLLNLTRPESEVRNSILDVASKEIFSHHNTGFLKKEEKLDFSIVEKIIGLARKSD